MVKKIHGKRFVNYFYSGMEIFFLFNDHIDMVLAPCNKGG